MRDPAQQMDLWDPLKYLALRDAEAWYVSLGGKARLRYEYFNHYLWGQGPQDSDGPGQIHAWTAVSDTGYTLRTVPWQPQLGLKADIISGDRNPKSRDLQTFNPLFPKGAYFGEIALIGPANLIDVHPSLELHPMPQVTVSADWDVFWRQSLQDGIYSNAVNLLRSGQQSRARLIGSQVSVQVEWQVERHTTLTAVYSHFLAGPFLRETGPGRDVDYASVWGRTSFNEAGIQRVGRAQP